MKQLLLFLISLLVGLTGSAQENEVKSAQTISLNGIWHFKTDPGQEGERAGWFKKNLPTRSWDTMPVPGNWDLVNNYAHYAGQAWYRLSFKLPDHLKGKSLRLVFESTSYYAKVWLNGRYLGRNEFGLLPCHYEIKDQIDYRGENVLAVQIDNTFKLGALWNWGGIRRPVWIAITPPQRLDYQHITAIPDLKTGKAIIHIKTALENQSDVPAKIDLKYSIRYQGKLVDEVWQQNISLPPTEKTIEDHVFHLDKEKVRLWDFDHPHLYESEVSLFKQGKKIHQIKDPFGIRKIAIEGYDLKLNGQTIRPVGFNLVPDDRTTGNTLPLWRIKQDVDLMKSMGANMARISHLALPKAFLDYLDQKGILVFSEVSLWGKNRLVNPDSLRPKKWLEKLIRTQYNHPCIIGWSVGNEIGFVNQNPRVIDYVQSAIQHAKSLDSNRLALYVSHSAADQKQDAADYEDMIFFNKYSNWGKKADRAHQLHPGKPIFYSEIGKSIVDEDPDKGVIAASEMLDDIRGRKYLIGASLWTFNDYRSNYTGTGPSENRAWGVVNVFRQPKRAYYSFKKEFAPVKAMDVETEGQAGRLRQLKVTLTPRDVLDIPSYPLLGYKMIWTALDRNGKVIEGGWIPLPDIYPGEKAFSRQITLQKYARSCLQVKVSLASPQLYSVLDTAIYLHPPLSPQIKAVYSSSKTIRVLYNQVPDAMSYQVIYSDGQETDTTKESINNFITIKDLERNRPYTFKVIARNNKGISPSSPPLEATLNEDELPPVIWNTIPSDHGFFVGYSSASDDFLYDIEYGTTPNRYSHRMVVRNKGVLKVSGLKNGQTYYYRLRSRKQWGFKSAWSPEEQAVPNGGLNPASPEVHGIIRHGPEAMVYFKPVPKTIGYKIRVKYTDGKESTALINAADMEYAMIPHFDEAGSVYISAVNQYGESQKIKIAP